MKIAFDNIIMQIQPDAMTWESPDVISRDGNFAPVRGQYYSCRLSMAKPIEPSLYDWQQVFNCQKHLVTLPHPFTKQMTDFCCYVDSYAIREDLGDTIDHCSVIIGIDIALSGIVVPSVSAFPFSFSFCGD